MSTLLKSVLLQTKKPEKVGNKSGMKGAKKAAARGSKGKGKKNLKKNPIIAAKTNSNNSKGKEDSKEKGKKSDDPCKLVTPESITFSHPVWVWGHTGLLEKSWAICEVGQVQGEYVSSYYAVPKSKRAPEK